MTSGTMTPTTRKYYRPLVRRPIPIALKKAFFSGYQFSRGYGRGRDRDGKNRSSLSDLRDDHFAVGDFVRAHASVRDGACGRPSHGMRRPPAAVSTSSDAAAAVMAADAIGIDPAVVRDRQIPSAPASHRRPIP
jgi:hypothetical protein